MDDVLDFRDTESSYFKTLKKKSSIQFTQRKGSASLTRKSLPPLDTSKSFDSSLNSSRSESQLESSGKSDITSDLLSVSINKKKSPDKIESIDPSLISCVDIRELDTPVTIDIITDTARYSRTSSSLLTREDTRFSSRPSSSILKENTPRKPSSGRLKSLESTLVETMQKLSVDTTQNETKNDRLDTIKESITETIRLNVKKLDLHPSKVSSDIKKPITSILKKPQTVSNNLNLNKVQIKPPDTLKLNTNKKPIVPIAKPVTNRSQSIDKTPKQLQKNPSCSNLSKTEPAKLESARIERVKKTSPLETPSDILGESFQSTLTNVTNVSSQSKSTICQSGDVCLEINSSRLSLIEKPQSAKSVISVGEPKQPLISTMFEGYPQPFVVPKVEKKVSIKPKSSSYPKKTVNNKQTVKSASNKQRNQAKPMTKKSSKSKIFINLSNQDIEQSLQREIDESIMNDVYDSEFDDAASISSKNSTAYLSDKEVSEIKLDEPETSLKAKATQIAIETEVATSRINKDFVKSFEDRVFAIYTKFDNLLQQQSNYEKVELLTNQKAQFSQEIAKELKDNIDFDQDDMNSDYKRLKDLYDMVQKNTNKEEIKVIEKPPLPDEKQNPSLNRMNSIKSNADIREVFSIVNSFGKNSLKSNNTAELTIVPGNRVVTRAPFKIPTNISDKINTLMVSLPVKNENSDESELIENFKINSKLKFNNVNKLDSLGNESRHSSESFDSNSISYHFDLKYKRSTENDRSKSPVSFQFESENDFNFRWKKGNLLGKGAFGSVFQALLSTGEIIAVKQIEMEESDPIKARKEYDSVREEVKILRELEHINIVQFMGTMLVGNVVNIFMELIPGGTIETLLKTFGPFEEDLFKIFTNQIVEGVNYLHSRNVVHRDIKGKNIMLMSNGVVKLIDFGCAKRLKKNQNSNSIKQLLKSLKGTPYWMSPEVIRETGHGAKADVWSLGATVFEMAAGNPPWSELSPLSAIYAIGNGESPPPELPEKYSEEARDFVRKCLTRDPELRPSAMDLLSHDFLTKQNTA